ncbi:MAG: formate/nitrite transporter family protein [Alphaproteobacteria bacterium]|nr:formate/nitrite transporter family protein [Alphaproteobacteria bacterium]
MSAHDDIGDRVRLTAPTIYEIVSTEGESELARSLHSLGWSGLVAGLCITFSLLCEGYIKYHLPPGGDYFLIENLGYTFGFIIVIMGRFQLFTENTITVVLPLLETWTWRNFFKTLKLWGVVLLTNFIGTFIVAFLICHFHFFSPEMLDILNDISMHAVDQSWLQVFQMGIPAGFLIACLVWMLPSADGGAEFWIIVLMTYIIAIGDFTHIIAGSAEAFLLLLQAKVSILQVLSFLSAAALGNILGGTGLFAIIAYNQVRNEI